MSTCRCKAANDRLLRSCSFSASPARWCSRLESNQRPPPYQGGALPTELRERSDDRRLRTEARRETAEICPRFSDRPAPSLSSVLVVERETGIEPALVAWKATVLP